MYYFILYSKFESEYLIKEEKVTHKEQDRLLEEALDKASAAKNDLDSIGYILNMEEMNRNI